MKKKLIGVTVVVAMALTAGWNYNQSNNEMAMSDLALANVEALAQDESSYHCERLCEYWPSTYCVLETSSSYIYCFSRYPY